MAAQCKGKAVNGESVLGVRLAVPQQHSAGSTALCH